ncbi:MAG TPA: Tm-1-like ATP-binding domain-containing protein [Terriglobales bacterium]|nr:Tm-1-like ATP-binding domain-containing protein [Terriglobales bacterium]
MSPAKRIGVVCTLDTKGEHAQLVKSLIEGRGHEAVLIDIGVLGDPAVAATISRDEVASAGGMELRALASSRDRGKALDVMTAGVTAILVRLHRESKLDGVIGMGGGGGTAVASAAMRALPVGVPKVMVSTMAGSGKAAAYVGTRDIVMVPTITDIIGMNPILRSALTNGAAAVCGMAEMGAGAGRLRQAGGRPTVAITAFGVTTPAAMRCHQLLTQAGCDTLIFHANGTGGRAMEELIEQDVIDAVLDLTTTELPDELCGGQLSAGPHRLEAAGARGLPQVVLPGAMDMVNFTTPETVPAKYANRRFYQHSPATRLMRTTVEENATLGRWVGEKLARAKRPAVLLLPVRGFSEYDKAGGVFYDPQADSAFMDAAVAALGKQGEVVRVDAYINEPACAETAVVQLLGMMRGGASSKSETA